MAYPFVDATALATVHPAAHNAWVDARANYGAVLDGTTDDTTAIQNAITATPNYGACFIPPTALGAKITSALTIDHPMTLFGLNSLVTQATAATKGIIVTSSNVTIEGLHLYGKQHANYVNLERAVHIVAPSWASAYSNVNVRNNWIENWGDYGIYAQWLTDFDFTHNRVQDIGYAGITGLSIQRGTVNSNRVDNLGPGTGANAYGMFFSRITTDAGELTTNPRSSDLSMNGNIISNNALWEGIDVHGAQRVTFAGNTIYNCKRGIAVGPSNNASAAETYAPLEVTVTGNTVDSALTSGAAGYGISFVGAEATLGAPAERATGSMTGNVITGYGTDAISFSGALYVHDTDALVVSGNFIKNGSPNGISVYHDNRGISITGNTFLDPWSEAQEIGTAVNVSSDYNTGTIHGNSFVRGGLAHTVVLNRGIKLYNLPNSFVTIGANYSSATRYLDDAQGASSIIDLYGSGTPEGVVYATKGSTFHRTDGGAGTGLYVKESGAGSNTGWVAK